MVYQRPGSYLKWIAFLAVFLKGHLRLRGEQAPVTAFCLEGAKWYWHVHSSQSRLRRKQGPHLVALEAFHLCLHRMTHKVYAACTYSPGFIISYKVIKTQSCLPCSQRLWCTGAASAEGVQVLPGLPLGYRLPVSRSSLPVSEQLSWLPFILRMEQKWIPCCYDLLSPVYPRGPNTVNQKSCAW